MPRYYRESTYHQQIRFIKLAKQLFFACLIIVLPLIVYLGYDIFSSERKARAPGVVSTETKSTYVSDIEVYRTEYFQFQAGKTWRAVSNESTPSKFVYHKLKNNLLEAQLIIYVNQPIDDTLDANRILSATFSTDSTGLKPLFVSAICSTDSNKRTGYKVLTLQGVSFRCNTDTTDYSVLVGKEGGSTQLDMLRPDGSKIKYVIRFIDQRAVAIPYDLETIIDTFQTR